MSAREAILKKVRGALNASAGDAERAAAVGERLAKAPKGIIPARGQLPRAGRIELFCTMAKKLSATVERVDGKDAVPKAVAAYLRQRNLPAALRMGEDDRLTGMPWDSERSLQVKYGPSDGNDEVGLAHATAAVAETGTLVMTSGNGNPTSINFLPEHHLVVVDADDIDGDLEAALGRIRTGYGKGKMPRTVNLISGPSRSADIEQKIILGAHGPRALHVIVVGE
ncbi:lactate utilization protein [Mesorhizobium sp. BAC0120]|uniref:LutC/YkgG family protein n=1 Tax=Mesorhizobium sp. BAC0120 TaxID=3090670 RepID=UPI00298C453D|nr:lactate utilization protein [Mesorhizobium sp. BAC0120]MDW6025157.1 lactate utilization protein [Mesorhizobium sp. BAC0120]